ncbi:MAG: Fic family protein, partial [Myxococcales bacterium]|nr:Fic family protein [Myxococcales bacterium]
MRSNATRENVRREDLSPVGYEALVRRYGLKVVPHFRSSYFASRGSPKVEIIDGEEIHVHRRQGVFDDSLGGHLQFALKHEGVNPGILRALFEALDPAELRDVIASRPLGKYTRIAWYLYELFMVRPLDLSDLTSGNYIDLLDPEIYYTTEPVLSPRHKVRDNLLGGRRFCPVVKRTKRLREYEEHRLDRKAAEIIKDYDPDLITRATRYLYTKETKSSFEIEHETPSLQRQERFINLLRSAPTIREMDRGVLLALQAAIVDERFANRDYRDSQVYVGESRIDGEIVHFVAPKPEDVPELMQGLMDSLRRMIASRVDPVIVAAVVSFGFVFIHPFDDGNGRIHRFLIHHILSRTGFTPPGLIFPVSATMLSGRSGYDGYLETFSKPVMSLIDYTLDEEGAMRVRNETANLYRAIDMTPICEYLYAVVEKTIDTELAGELRYLEAYDRAVQAMREVVDLPGRLANLFFKLCVQNGGHVSPAKRRRHFSMLADEEVERLESAIERSGALGLRRPADIEGSES